MNFYDEAVEKLDLSKIKDLETLIVEFLCGEVNYNSIADKVNKSIVEEFITRIKNCTLNYEQFNEILLLFNQGRISRDFYEFFFGEDKINLKGIKKGVIKFRGYAMLCYGNFRFAYKDLMKNNFDEINSKLRGFCENSNYVENQLKRRPKKILRIDEVSREDTWLLGETFEKKIQKEIEYINNLQKNERKKNKILKNLSREYLKLGERITRVIEKGQKNTEVYLTWDYMDIYIATSMRSKIEFNQTYDFIKKVFSNKKIKDLKLRYFDPTQSKCKNRIDKGLLEGLMLKRVIATIYMVQESDTMGKDSEFASTLAQGKPVIAYIPRIEINEILKEIQEYSFSYFVETFNFLNFKNIFSNNLFTEMIKEELIDYKKIISDFREFISSLEEDSQDNKKIENLFLFQDKKSEELKSFNRFNDLFRIIAIGKYCIFEERARVLKEYHPLSIQIVLETGVANGVLVVRNEEECSKLLFNLVTNNLDFIIEEITGDDWKITTLIEKNTGCPFRVVTNDQKITNSFWNFYLESL
jgi:hypothetical protein